MKKYILILFIFSAFPLLSQEYTLTISKQQAKIDLLSWKAYLIEVNNDLVDANQIMEDDNSNILNNEFMDAINSNIIKVNKEIAIYEVFIESDSIDDIEIIYDFLELQKLFTITEKLYAKAKSLHFKNISYSNNVGSNSQFKDLLVNSLDMFLGVKFFSTLNSLNQK